MLTISGDISEPAATDRVIGEVLDRFGRIDTLINNAGIFIAKPFTDYTADDYASVVAVNLTGFFTLTQRAIAEMLKRSGGHIFLESSPFITAKSCTSTAARAPATDQASGERPGRTRPIAGTVAPRHGKHELADVLDGEQLGQDIGKARTPSSTMSSRETSRRAS